MFKQNVLLEDSSGALGENEWLGLVAKK